VGQLFPRATYGREPQTDGEGGAMARKVLYETSLCSRCGRRRRVRTIRRVTGAGKIVAWQSRCVDEQDCDEFMASLKQS
jgi:hypothetical protein